MSPDHRFVFLTQIQAGELETEQGTTFRELAYCSLVRTDSGCIVAHETGEFCGGTFTANGGWENPVSGHDDLDASAPTARDYIDGKRAPGDAPEATLENLLACDLPSATNRDAYRHILKDNTFGLDQSARAALRRRLEALAQP
ncbi:hypothetical protein [Xanthomonas maliensis]|uniref:hypothetical protein n=1 Tax=Xanthomonas maliensis TaxID=1321368 RepID=UPI00039E87D2|nr:hypothetical protein [Xanthomonas maliensis]KAB7769648.1 hypothetical protein CKY51_05740 [Xanthomonas maliensis]